MQANTVRRFCWSLAPVALALLVAGCNGGGSGGGSTTNNTTTPTVNAAAMTPAQWAALNAQITVNKVTINSPPVVDFTVKDGSGNGIVGLGFTTQSTSADRSGNYAIMPSLSNLTFSLAKLVPESAITKAPSHWVNYVVTTVPTRTAGGTAVPTAPGKPTTDATGTLVDHGDGSYTYTFYRDIKATQAFLNSYTYSGNNTRNDLGDVTYEPTRIHRLTIQFSGSARGTGTNTPNGQVITTGVDLANPVNKIYDWVPSTGQAVSSGDSSQREIVNISKCQECHDTAFKTAPHAGRVDTRYCVVCHTDQRKYGSAVSTPSGTAYSGSTNKFALSASAGTTLAAGDFPVFIHKIHMGDSLTKTGYNYANLKFETMGYPMGRDMCSKCHSGASGDAAATAQGENWYLKPTRLACMSCHDSANFDTGWTTSTSYAHAAYSDDTACASCHVDPSHTPTNTKDVKVAHYVQNVNLTTHNPVIKPGLVNFKYEVAQVTQATSGGAMTIKFRILSDQGVAGGSYTPVTFAAANSPAPTQIVAGFTGSPAFLLAWAIPQESISSPADYNNLKADGSGPLNAGTFQPSSISISTLLNTANAATTGTLSGPDGSGYYTANIVAAKAFPAGAKLRSVALQSYFSQVTPAAARHTVAAYAYVSGESRRISIDSNKCSNCHEQFEGHGGQRVKEVQVCVMCHVPSLTTSGRSMTNSAISTAYATLTATQKTTLGTWTGVSWATDPTPSYTNLALKFPQTTNNFKDMIHGIHMAAKRTDTFKDVRGDRWALVDASSFVFPGVINQCTDCHTYNGYSGAPTSTFASREEAILSGSANSTAADAATALTLLNTTDLMTTPFTASCVSCHDTASDKTHMAQNGGQIKVVRSSLNSGGESCATCHGAGSTYDPVVVHQ